MVWDGLVWDGLVWSGTVWDGLGWSGMVWAHIGVVFRDSREGTMAVEGLLSPVASHRGSRK